MESRAQEKIIADHNISRATEIYEMRQCVQDVINIHEKALVIDVPHEKRLKLQHYPTFCIYRVHFFSHSLPHRPF